MQKVGYARKTIEDENIVQQVEALSEYGCNSIFQDSESRLSDHLPQLEAALEKLEANDALVVWKLDRLGKSLRQLTQLAKVLKERNIYFVSLKEGIDTSTAGGESYFKRLEELAEMEGALIREKTLIGLKEARKKGKIGGRPKIDAQKVAEIRHLYFNEKHTIQYISDKCNVSVGSVYKYINLPDGNENQKLV